MKQHNRRRGIVASIGALVAAAALALGGAAAAQAAPTIPDVLPAQDDRANLVITKLSTPTAGATIPTGDVQANPTGSTPVQGVGYTVKQVLSYAPTIVGGPAAATIDLTTNAGWQTLAALNFDAASGKWYVGTVGDPANEVTPAFGTPAAGTTDKDGVPCITPAVVGVACGAGNFAFRDMPIGLYHVAENSTPAGVTGSAPFVVTLPMTNAATDPGTTWNYTVHVYPKASVTAIRKTVNDAAPYTVGTSHHQQIIYTIDADVPRNPGPTANTFVAPTGYVIEDQLNAVLTPTNVTVTLTGTAVTLVPSDYTVTPATFAAGDLVKVSFENAGLVKLGQAASTAGSQVQVVITAAVAESATGGFKTNTANLFPDAKSVADDNPIISPVVDTVWYQANFKKTDNAGANLPGAEFKVFLDKSKAEAGQPTDALRGATAAVSQSTGDVTVTGLRASNWANGAMQYAGTWDGNACVANASYIVYWLTETKAPTGYELLASPVPFALLNDGTMQQVSLNADGSVQLSQDGATGNCKPTLSSLTSIKNVEKNAGFALPLTGGMGTAFLTVIGVGILGFVVFMARRRRSEEAAN